MTVGKDNLESEERASLEFGKNLVKMPTLYLLCSIAFNYGQFESVVMTRVANKGNNPVSEWFNENFYELFIKMICEILNHMCSMDTKKIELVDEESENFDFKYMIKLRINKDCILDRARNAGTKLYSKFSDR